MINAERKLLIDAPPTQVRAALADFDHLHELLPRLEHAEVLARGDNRARVALTVRMGRLGTQRIEGEVRLLENGLRFVAVEPMEVDARWTVVPREAGAEVIAQLAIGLPRRFASMTRLIPQRMIADRIGAELESALQRLASITQQKERAAGHAPESPDRGMR